MMKNPLKWLALAAACAVWGCAEDDENTNNAIQLGELVGDYTLENSTNPDYVACDLGPLEVQIAADSLELASNEGNINMPLTSLDGCPTGGQVFFFFEFVNGNTLNAGLVDYKILRFDGTNLKWEVVDKITNSNAYVEDLVKK